MTQTWLWSRPLAPLLAGLAAGIAAPSLGLALPEPWLAGTAIVLLLFLAGCCWWDWPGTWVGVLLFFCLGQGLYDAALHPALPPHHVSRLPSHAPITLLGTVQSRPLLAGADYRLELAALARYAGSGWQPADGALWLSGVAEPGGLKPGDTVAVRLTIRPVKNLKNPGAFDRRLALARRHIYATGRVWGHLQPVRLASESSLGSWSAWREQARSFCRSLLDTQPQPARAVFLALLLGDQTEISPALRQALARTGTSHLLAISGLHLAMLAGVAYFLIFWLLRRSAWLLLRLSAPKWSAALAAVPVLAYVWLAGGSPATLRAAIMILAYLLLVLLDRHREVYSVMILAAFLILAASPLMLYSLSFQLSFLSVWGLACLAPILQHFWQDRIAGREQLASCKEKYLRWVGWGLAPVLQIFWRDRLAVQENLPFWPEKILRWVGRGLSVSLAATLATLPVIAASFHQAPTYGILVNLVAVPLMGGLALPLGFLALTLAWLPGPLTSGLLYVSRQFLELGLWLIEKAATLPGVTVRLPEPTLWQTAAYFVMLLSLFTASRRLWRWTGFSLGLLAVTAPLVWSSVPGVRGSHLLVTVLDVPREMAVAATLPRGATLVASAGAPRPADLAGPPSLALLSVLHARQVRRLDYLCALSVTPENAGTLLALAREFPVGEFWYSGERPPLPDFWELRNLLGDEGREVKNLSLAPLSRDIDGVLVRTRQLADAAGSRPRGPILLELHYQGQGILMVPPAAAAWRRQCLEAGLPVSQVLILPASNLKTDFLATCLAQVKPRMVVVTGALPGDSPLSPGPDIPWHHTRRGAVTIKIALEKVEVSQWRP